LRISHLPFSVGDKIALSSPSEDTSPSGSSTWFVEQVTLFTTTVRFATTNEVATYSNGSLASLRIINAKRSPKAVLYVYVKFGSDAPFHKLNVFRSAIENFVKARPREVSL
jgi:small-conductance mechanosensitive channel